MSATKLVVMRCKHGYWNESGNDYTNVGELRLLTEAECVALDDIGKWEEVCVYTGTDSVAFTPYAKPHSSDSGRGAE